MYEAADASEFELFDSTAQAMATRYVLADLAQVRLHEARRADEEGVVPEAPPRTLAGAAPRQVAALRRGAAAGPPASLEAGAACQRPHSAWCAAVRRQGGTTTFDIDRHASSPIQGLQ